MRGLKKRTKKQKNSLNMESCMRTHTKKIRETALQRRMTVQTKNKHFFKKSPIHKDTFITLIYNL